MLREYIYNREFQVLILNNMINVLNYTDIISFDDNKIILKHAKGTIIIIGQNLTITKLLDSEMLIKGKITNIELR